MIKKLLATLSLLMAVAVSATILPQQSAVPGGVVIVELVVPIETKPVVSYNKRQVMVVKEK